uniref:Uncharacterized protein n=1 Tax=Panagrolaimus superbus TaxID=310955 RepID=A0A914YHM0_9BILA
MDENYINPVFKKNLLLTYNLLSGEVRRMRNGYADTLITMERRLGEKNTEIKTLIEEQQNLSDKLDEASKEIGNNDCLVKEMDRIKHEKLIEHSENAAENRRRCEKLGILMKHVNDVVLVEKKTDDKTKKKRKSSNKPSSSKI